MRREQLADGERRQEHLQQLQRQAAKAAVDRRLQRHLGAVQKAASGSQQPAAATSSSQQHQTTTTRGLKRVARGWLRAALHRGQARLEALEHEADAKAESLALQLGQVKGDAKARIEDRMKRVKRAYHSRGAKLSQAWHLTKEALTA